MTTGTQSTPAGQPCRCRDSVPWWRQRDTLVSPASFWAGVTVVAVVIAVAAVSGDGDALLGATVLVLLAYVGAAAVAAVVARIRGHHGTCVLGHALYAPLVILGLPLRVLLSLFGSLP